MPGQQQDDDTDKKSASSRKRIRPKGKPKNANKDVNSNQPDSGSSQHSQPKPSDNNKNNAQKKSTGSGARPKTPQKNPKSHSKSTPVKETPQKIDNNKNTSQQKSTGSGARPKTPQKNPKCHLKSTPVKETPQKNGQNNTPKKAQKKPKPAPTSYTPLGFGYCSLSAAGVAVKTQQANKRKSSLKCSSNTSETEKILGKLEQEMKEVNAVITVAGNHVVVSPRIVNDKAGGDWRGGCEKALKNYLSTYTVRTIEVDTFDPTHYTNEAVDVHLQKSVGGVLTISVTGPSKLVEQTVHQVKERSNQILSQDGYIKPGYSAKITPHLRQNVLAKTAVKMNWDRANFLKLTGKKNAIAEAKRMINEQLEEANDDLRIVQSHIPRASSLLLQHVRSKTGAFLRWTNPELLSICGIPRSVEMARQMIIDEIYRVDLKKISAPGWVLDRCRDTVTEAKQFFPEIEIWSEQEFICIRGHPSETFGVYNKLNVAVQRFGEFALPVKKKFHAALIGKNGSKITDIQNRHKVQVVIPPRDSPCCDILLRGGKQDVIQAKFEIANFIKQLEQQNSTLSVPLSQAHVQRISDEFIQKMKREHNTEVTKNEDGVLLKGKQEVLQKVKDSVMAEISVTMHAYVSAEDWLKPMLMDSLQGELAQFPDVQVAPDCVADEVVLTGHPYEVRMLDDIMSQKVAELNTYFDCITVTVEKKFHRNIIGAKGHNITRLREQYKVEITIPPNLSDSCGVKVQGPRQGVEAAVNDIRNLVSNLDNNSKKILRFSKDETVDIKRFVREMNLPNSKVKVKFDHNKVTFNGPNNDVEPIAAKLKELLRINRQKTQTISIPLNSAQAFAIVKSRKNPVLDDLKNEYEGRVRIDFDYSVPAVLLKGSGKEMNEAHVKVVERLHDFNDIYREDGYPKAFDVINLHKPRPDVKSVIDFCVLDIRINECDMGRFIGKDGRNVKSMQQNYRMLDIITDRRSGNSEKNVTLVGKADEVEQAFEHIRCRYNAIKVRYQRFVSQSRRGSAAIPSSMPEDQYPYYDGDDDDSVSVCSSVSDFTLEMESMLYEWHSDPPVVKLVKKSETFTKELQNLFPDESILMDENNGVIKVAGQANDSYYWQNIVDRKLCDFFQKFTFQQISFHPRTIIDKIPVNTKDLVITWDDKTANICGVSDKVSEKLTEFESIQKRKRAVCERFSYENCLIRFMKRNSNIEGTVTIDGSHITLTNENVEFHSEILEVDSKEEWKTKCKSTLDEIFCKVTYRKVKIPPIHCGKMRTECCQHYEYVVEWIQEESSLLIYGLKEQVLKEAKRLENVLFHLKNKKKKVSTNYRCENAEISTFIKDSVEHLEGLVNDLGNLGSPDLDSDIITVIGEILETESTAKWEEKCRAKIEQYLSQYKVAQIQVADNIRTRCVSLARSGSGVVTRWSESEGAFRIVGIKQLVNVTERFLNGKINELREEEQEEGLVLRYGNDESVQFLAEENESSINVPLTDTVARYLELEEARTNLQDVTIAKTTDGVKITGRGRRLQQAREYIDSIFAEELSIKKFGVYGLLKENSTRWQIESQQIENNCTIHIERLRDAEYGNDKFILLPKNSNLPVTVEVEEGDITIANVDLIVNTTSKSFSFDGPLSRCIFQRAGQHLRDFIEVIDSDIRCSEGGSLNCKGIFHVALPKPRESMEELILKILRKADEKEMKSIAMPTIGAGNGGWKSQDISMAMQNAFTKFATESSNLKLIKVVLFSGMSKYEKEPFHQNVKIRTPSESNRASGQEPQGFVSFLRSIFKRPEPVPVQREPRSPQPAPPVVSRPTSTDESQHASILVAATNQADLDKAVDEVQRLTSHHIQEFEFDNVAVLRINQSDLDVLEKMANEQNVRVIVNKSRDVHKITVQGKYQGASKVKDKVQEILGGTLSDLPAEWIPSAERMTSVSLDCSSLEYQNIEKLFQEGNKRSGLSLIVYSICRIQNPTLYRQYQSKKSEIANRPNPPRNVEMRLFHGTDENTIDLICRNGFNRSYAGRNATAYGKGTYFSTESSYSNSFASANGIGRSRMFVADVLTGDYCQGDPSMIDAPRNPYTQELYDSVVDRAGLFTPSIYVVFRDWSAYPSYVITYTAS